VPNGVAQGLAGYAFSCPDMIGGGEGGDVVDPQFRVDQEFFVRYAQCAALFPMMQFSTAPWRVLDAEHVACCVAAAHLHTALGPEIVALAEHAAQTGEPILRHLAYVFPHAGYEQISGFCWGIRSWWHRCWSKGHRSARSCFHRARGGAMTAASCRDRQPRRWRHPWRGCRGIAVRSGVSHDKRARVDRRG
jgi:hypothetical protein